ncbi:MAG: chemotaxis protein CheA [Spirochaetaceae bacterium]|nr:MAG: chemotaxis protein CheA [Spirochaetaceae bacterium]
MSDYLDPQNEELLNDFFVEAEMQIESLESNILVLENDTNNSDAIDEIFRAAHTLKGASATVQMSELAEFTHLVEDVLDGIREGKTAVDGDVVDVLLQAIDIIKEMIQTRREGDIYSGDITLLKEALKAIQQSVDAPKIAPKQSEHASAPSSPASPPSPTPSTGTVPASGTGLSEYEYLELKEAADGGVPVLCVRVTFNEDNPMNTVGGIQVFAALRSIGTVLKTTPDFEALYEDAFYEHVDYYVTCRLTVAEIQEAVHISDVTLAVDVVEVVPGAEQAADPVADTAPTDATAGETPIEEVESKVQIAESPVEPARDTTQSADEDEPDEVQVAAAVSGIREEARRTTHGSILRVDSRRIDNLLNLVSETVITKATFNQLSNRFTETLVEFQGYQSTLRNQVKELFDSMPDYLERAASGASIKDLRREISTRYEDIYSTFDPFQSSFKGTIAKYRNTAQNLGRITGELQEGVMRIRMVPISQIFSRFPRLIRDLSKSLKKSIDLKIEGEDTELDKSVIEDLLDPLLHCVRNSLDHGIETPEQRREAGKSDAGSLTLKAGNEGNMILIEIIDDGKGIDVDAVKAKAVDRGLVHPSKTLTDIEAFNLIFHPGFSTASKITNVSGRGVGLDVVKRQIDKLNGEVTVWSERGVGTRFTIKIPLTLAIIQGLLVRVGKEIYVIPITSVIESHRIKPSEIKMLDNYEVFNVRDDVISLLRLNHLFKIPSEEQREHYFVVIVGSGDKKMGLIVDSLIGEEDVVIKPLRDHFTNSPGIAGANITGDGTVSLIIDVSQLLELGFRNELEQRKRRETQIR